MKELNKEIVKLKSTVKIGQASFEEEHKLRIELEDVLKVWFYIFPIYDTFPKYNAIYFSGVKESKQSRRRYQQCSRGNLRVSVK